MIRHVLLQYLHHILFLLIGLQGVAFAQTDRLPRNEDAIAAARLVKAHLEATDEQLVTVMRRLETNLDDVIKNVPVRVADSDFTNEREALLLLDRVMEQLIKQSGPVLATQKEYLEIGNRYRSELSGAGPNFRAAADQCRAYAAQETFTDFRDDYLRMASILDNMVVRCEQMPSDIAVKLQAIEELFPYLQHGQQVLVRFRSVIATMPVLNTAQELDALDERLKAYAQSYEKYRGALKRLDDRLRPEAATESRSDDNVARLQKKIPAPVVFKTRSPSAAIQFASSTIHREMIRPTTNPNEPEPTLAFESTENEGRFSPLTRNVLLYILPENPTQNRQTEIKVATAVEVGQSHRIPTNHSGVSSVTVREKYPMSAAGDIQYWIATCDIPRN